MTLYTKRITLTETTEAEFQRRKEFWRRTELRVHENSLVTTVENPLFYSLLSADPVDDYNSFFEMLFNHSYLPLLCVRTPRGWGKLLKKQADKSDLRTFAEFAAAQPEKINYLEVKFHDKRLAPTVRVPFPFHQPVIEFTEGLLNGQKAIIGYQVHLPQEYQHMFTVNPAETKPYNLIHGLWVP